MLSIQNFNNTKFNLLNKHNKLNFGLNDFNNSGNVFITNNKDKISFNGNSFKLSEKIIENLPSQLTEKFTGIFQKTKKIVRKTMESFKTDKGLPLVKIPVISPIDVYDKRALEEAKELLDNPKVSEFAKNQLSEAIRYAQNTMTDDTERYTSYALNLLRNAIDNAKDSIKEKTVSMMGHLTETIGIDDLSSKMGDFGDHSISNGLSGLADFSIDGIEHGIDSISDHIEDAATGFLDLLKDFFF